MAATNQQKAAITGSALLLSEPALALMTHGSALGMIVGAGIGLAGYVFSDEIEQAISTVTGGKSVPSLPSGATEKAAHLGYRLLNGKSVRSDLHEAVTEKLPDDEPLIEFGDEDELLTPVKRITGKFLFSEVLRTLQPTLDRIYVGSTPEGTPLFCQAKHLCHVALAGATGNGKSSIIRMLLAQLCKAGATTLLLNPHYTRYDLESEEDWTPFDPYLHYPPMEGRKYEVIEHYLRTIAEDLLPKRLDKYAHSQPVGRPYFIVLDELPAIVRNVKGAPEYLSSILREGRKVGVYLIVASQDFLVKTISPDGSGGGVRDCYRTAFYVGGDATTAKILLDMPAKEVPEDELGEGVVMYRGRALKKAAQIRVPYVDNEALYRLLGPSTFQPEPEEPSWEDLLAEVEARPEVDPQDTRYSDGEPLRLIPAMPRVPDDDILLERGIQAYLNGATSLDKLAVALDLPTQHQARKLKPRIENAIRERQQEVVNE